MESHPRAWLEYLLGRDLPEVIVVSADLATFTTEADKILRVEADDPWIVHVEFETSYKADTPLRAQRYNILARYRHGLPVQSIIVLLRPVADGPEMTGLLEQYLPNGTRYHEFRYNVIRVWEISAQEILNRDVHLLPLAPVSRVDESQLPSLIRQMQERIDRELPAPEAAEVWVATYLLMGMIHTEGFVQALLQGVRHMQESTTYQAILRKGIEQGRMQEAKRTLLNMGSKRFGVPDRRHAAFIDSISDLKQVDELNLRLFDVTGWEELLGE